MYPQHYKRFVCTAFSVAIALAVEPIRADHRRQPQVIVTATRTAIAVDKSLSSVSVIDRATIEAAGALDFATLLRREAGVDVVRAGGLGQQTSVFLRGSNSNQVLVLVDGVRVASANSGAFAWEFLPLAQIDRIEIVRGARAALYGSDAIGGVVQVFTRRNADPHAQGGAGNHDTYLAGAGTGGAGSRGRFSVNAGFIRSAGFNAQNPSGFSFDPDRDGYLQRSLSANGEWKQEHLVLDGALLHSENTVEFDQGRSQSDNSALMTRGRGDDWQLQVSAAREVLNTPAFFSRFETRRRQFDWQQVIAPDARDELLWGLSAVREDGRVIDTLSGVAQYTDAREQAALFVTWRAGRGAFDWEIAARHDDFDSFGGETVMQAALGWQWTEAFKLRANLGEGFRAPNLNELYSPGYDGFFAGNPALDPERAQSAELAADVSAGTWHLGLRGYRTRVRDLVDFAGGETFRAINIGHAQLQGIEIEGHWQRGNWRILGNLGWQDAEDRDRGTALLRRPPRKGNLALECALGHGGIGAEIHAAGPSPDFGRELPGQALLALFVRWPLTRALELSLRIDNALDRDYQSIGGFNAPGMSMLLQLRWRAVGQSPTGS